MDCHGNTFLRIVADWHVSQGMDPELANKKAYNDMPFLRKLCYDYDVPYWPVTRSELMCAGVPYSATCPTEGEFTVFTDGALYLPLSTHGHQQPLKRKLGYHFEFKEDISDSEFVDRFYELPDAVTSQVDSAVQVVKAGYFGLVGTNRSNQRKQNRKARDAQNRTPSVTVTKQSAPVNNKQSKKLVRKVKNQVQSFDGQPVIPYVDFYTTVNSEPFFIKTPKVRTLQREPPFVEYSGTVGPLPMDGADKGLEGNCFFAALSPLLRPCNDVKDFDPSIADSYEELLDAKRVS